MFDLKNKTVLITGASRGIGLQIADAYAGQGSNVIIVAEDESVLSAAEKLSQSYQGKITPIICDITDHDVVKKKIGSLSSIDILINNAGTGCPTPLLEGGDEVEVAFRKTFEVNVFGTFYVTRAVAPIMNDGGSIIYTSSIQGKMSPAEYSAYSGTKHAVIAMMRAAAKELGFRGINANAVCPGLVRTELAENLAEEAGLSIEEMFSFAVRDMVIDPGALDCSDLTGLYMFLSSPWASQITGQAINVDKGECMH